MIALYRVNGNSDDLDYYYIHTYQGNLFSRYTFTTIWGKNVSKGREVSWAFSSREEMDNKMAELFRQKCREDYKLLYSYPAQNGYISLFEAAIEERAV